MWVRRTTIASTFHLSWMLSNRTSALVWVIHVSVYFVRDHFYEYSTQPFYSSIILFHLRITCSTCEFIESLGYCINISFVMNTHNRTSVFASIVHVSVYFVHDNFFKSSAQSFLENNTFSFAYYLTYTLIWMGGEVFWHIMTILIVTFFQYGYLDTNWSVQFVHRPV